MVTVATMADDESISTIVRLESRTTGVQPEVYSFTGTVAITEGRFVDTGREATVTATTPGALATPSAVSTIVTGFNPTPAVEANVTNRNAAWYSAIDPAPVNVNTPVAALNVPLIGPDPL